MKQDLSYLFSRYPHILSAYLFGSTALGISNSDSDIDIAIRIDQSLASDSYLELRIELTDDLEKHLGCEVDIVVLNTASLKMIHQVIINGRLLFSRNLEKEKDYIVQKRKEYFDFRYYINKDIQEMRSYFGVSKNA
ncbi:MAG: nucleotidyltransferase domain-containing protein [Deltaproteobacteria bacterium]|nr:nucleotidyltransferase domain-containing protein [Deltaproteobacteria bacterium]